MITPIDTPLLPQKYGEEEVAGPVANVRVWSCPLYRARGRRELNVCYTARAYMRSRGKVCAQQGKARAQQG